MNKNKYLAALLASSMALTGCLESSSSDEEPKIDYRDNLTDVDLAKDFTNRFGKVESAIYDMQEPMIETSSQFLQDVSSIDTDAVEASLEVLDATLLAALLPVSNAIEFDGANNVTGIDYDKMAGTYYLAQIMDVACEQNLCSEAIDTSTAAQLTVSGNVMSVRNAQISSELFATHPEWVEGDNGFKEVVVRDESLGQFSNTVSFDITLPEENLGSNNSVGISISNLTVTSADTGFSISIDNLGADAQIESNASLTLSDLITTQEQVLIDKINANLSNAVIEFGDATFKGNLDLNVNEGLAGLDTSAAISGELINSKGDSIKAVLDLGRTEYQYTPTEYQYDFNENPDGSWDSSNSLNGAESYKFDYSLELVFDSVEHGELAVKLSALGSYEDEKSEEGSSSYDGVENNDEYRRSYTEELMANGDIEIRVANEAFKVSYNLSTDLEDTGNRDSSSDNESTSWNYNESTTSVSTIKISDATYTKRSVYMLIDTSSSFTSSQTDQGDSANQSGVMTSGVYVDETLYGQLVFDPMNNTQDIVFTDGTKFSLSN